MRYRYPSERRRHDWAAIERGSGATAEGRTPDSSGAETRAAHGAEAHQPKQGSGGPSATTAANNSATAIVSYLITGPAVYGGIGHLIDRWLGTGFVTGIGALIGMALSLYLVWLRYGRR